MVESSFLNPFCDEALNIVRNQADLSTVFDVDSRLVDIISFSPHQNLSDESYIPENIINLALKRIKWYIERKNNKEYNSHDYAYLFVEDITQYDVIAFHLTAQAIANKFNFNSREMKLFIQSQGQIIEDRLGSLMLSEKRALTDDVLGELMVSGTVEWTFLKDIISSKKLSLTDLVIDNGEVILDRDEFIYRFEDKFDDRSASKMYDVLVGDNVKEEVLKNLIMQKTEEYIGNIQEKSQVIEPHPSILTLADEIEKTIDEEMTKYSTFYANLNNPGGYMEIGKLVKEAFPPCIKSTVEGVSSGGRNDAIVLFLTSFASYARLYPGIFANEGAGIKVSDIDKNLNITEREILPLIFEAADNCTPPLFEDQPQEKINIISKLGFGMHSEVSLDHEGETKWYTPMSCEKVKIHLPQLCKKDKGCKGINNPLSYYTRAKWNLKKEGKLPDSNQSGTNSNSGDGD